MADTVAPIRYSYDAFISYSRVDEAFAVRLQRALEKYKPPRDLEVPQRNLEIFRDKEDFTAGDYHENLARHLGRSAKLIVVCSPDARQSKYVDGEIELFAQLRGAEHIIPVLYRGVPNNEAGSSQANQMAFPEQLCRVMKLPLAVDYRSIDERNTSVVKEPFSQEWYSILEKIYDQPRAAVEQREKRRLARARRRFFGSLLAIIAALSVALIFALISRRDARRAATEAQNALGSSAKALSRRGETLHEALFVAITTPEQGLSSSPEALGGAWEGLTTVVSRLGRRIPIDGPGVGSGVDFLGDGRMMVTAGGDGFISLWDLRLGRRVKTVGQYAPTGIGSSRRFIDVERSADDRYVLGRFNGPTIQIWDLRTDSLVLELDAPVFLGGLDRHVQQMMASRMLAQFSPDGRYVAATNPSSITTRRRPGEFASVALTGMTAFGIWNLQTRKLDRTFAAHSDVITAITYAPLGDRIATGTADGTIRLWSFESPTPLATVHCSPERGRAGAPNSISRLQFTRDGQQLFSAGDDGQLRIWHVSQPTRPRVVRVLRITPPVSEYGQADSTFTFDINHAGTRLVSENGGRANLWDLGSGRRIALLDDPEASFPVAAYAFSPDGELVATASATAIRLWDAERGFLLRQIEADGLDIERLRFSPAPHSLVLVTSEFGGPATIWSLQGEALPRPLWGTARYLRAADAWPSTTHIGWPPNVRRVDVTDAVVSPDRRFIATLSAYGVGQILTPTGSQVSLLGDLSLENRGAAFRFSRNGSRFLAQNRSDELLIFEIPTGRLVTRVTPPEELRSAALSPDGRFVAMATGLLTDREFSGAPRRCDPDRFKIEIIEAATRRLQRTLRGHCGEIRDLDFSSDGRFLVSASADSTARVWPLHENGPPTVLHGHTAALWHTVYAQDCNVILTSSQDSTVIVWDSKTFIRKRTLRGHPGWAVNAHVADDCSRIVTTSGGTVFLWETNSGRALGRFVVHDEKFVNNADFLSGADVVLSVGQDGFVQIYSVSASAWFREARRLAALLSPHPERPAGTTVRLDSAGRGDESPTRVIEHPG